MEYIIFALLLLSILFYVHKLIMAQMKATYYRQKLIHQLDLLNRITVLVSSKATSMQYVEDQVDQLRDSIEDMDKIKYYWQFK